MDEKRISELMKNLDNDLILQELDDIMAGIDIDADSISQKAHWKLRKEQHSMNKHKKKIMGIIAASLVAICGVTAVYASEISNFIQSLMGKTGVYGTVVEGQTYYLANPIALGDGNRLEKAMFNKSELQIQLEMVSEGFPEVKIRVNGIEMEPHGMEGYNNLFFYNIEPTNQFDLILDGKSYPVQLTSSQSVVDGSEIIEVESENIPWLSMGYKKIKGGIQILVTPDDPSVRIVFFNTPGKDTIKQTTDNHGGHTYREEFLPMLGYDKNGTAYEFRADPDDMGRPLTKYTTDAPAGKELTVTLPSIVVTTEKSINLKVAIPPNNEKQTIPQAIDLGLQKMQLESIERTSETTARLFFTLNTGEQNGIRVWETYLGSKTAESTESLWENGTCVMDVTFPSGTSELQIDIASPIFIVDGNWTFHIK